MSEENNKYETERSQYEDTVTMAELRRMTIENNRKNGRKPLTLDEINQYTKEVRDAGNQQSSERERENRISYKGRTVCLSNKSVNALFMLCHTYITESTIDMYLGAHFGGFKIIEDKIKEISDAELTKLIEECVKEEFILLCGEGKWNKVMEYKV